MYVGHDGVRDFWRLWLSAWETTSFEYHEFIDAGEHVVVVGRFSGRARSGATLDAPFVHVHRLRNGKTVHFQNYVDATRWASAWG